MKNVFILLIGLSLIPFTLLSQTADKSDWQGGVPLTELLERVNRVAESFLPPRGGPGSGAGRVKRTFTERSFRHYQTLRWPPRDPHR